MPVPKKYFHDRLVILLLGINAFLVLVGALLVLFRLDSSPSAGYITEYRANFGVGEFKTGSSFGLATFVIYLFANMTLAVMLSMRTYNLRRHVSLMILSLSVVASLLAIVVSNALLVLR
jgi:hypothetical protein